MDAKRQLAYFELRLGWIKGRILGDLLPDHPKWGPIPTGTAWTGLVLKAIYLPAVVEMLNSPSILMQKFFPMPPTPAATYDYYMTLEGK